MPAKSRSQQRLFGMVHAYQKGEFHGSRSLRNRVAALARRVSEEDARHFAETPHDRLPEKKAQVMLTPEQSQQLIGHIPPEAFAQMVPARSERRRSVLGSALHGGIAGAVGGGVGLGALGALWAYSTMKGNPGASGSQVAYGTLLAALRSGLLGAKWGAPSGALIGSGRNVLDRIKE